MSTAPDNVIADPAKPYKAYLAAIGLIIGLMWANLQGRPTLDGMDLMDWLTVIVPTVLTTIAVYTKENPKVYRNSGRV